MTFSTWDFYNLSFVVSTLISKRRAHGGICMANARLERGKEIKDNPWVAITGAACKWP